MQISIITYLIVCPLVVLAGFVDSVAGGGGVISLPAYLLAGIPIKLAAGTNKFANGWGTALASYNYAKSGNVDWGCALPAAVFSLLGSTLGTSLAVYLPDALLQAVVLIALPLVAVTLLLPKKKKQAEPSAKKARLLSCLIGLAVGCYDGLVGPGTGTFLTLAFSGLLGYSLLKSAGCARIANLASNVASMVVFLLNGKILLAVALPATACAMLGNYLGSQYAIGKGSDKIRLVMFFVLGLLFLKIGLQFLGIIDF